MLATLGYASLDELLAAALPDYARPPACSPRCPRRAPRRKPSPSCGGSPREHGAVSMIGLGYYDTVTPAVIRRNVLENPAWYTAYTPYQPEISQGRLEALLNFQTMVVRPDRRSTIANASLLDEASAAVEAMPVAAARGSGGDVFLADADCLPQTLDVLRTRAEPLGIELRVAPARRRTDFAGVFGVLLQYPGAIRRGPRPRPSSRRAHAAGARVAVARRPARADPARAAGRVRRRHRARHHPALRRADRLRRPARRATWRSATTSSGSCPAASSASRWTPTATPPTGSRCRRASSTSAGRRRRATSAPRRCCSRSWPRCTPCTTAPTG